MSGPFAGIEAISNYFGVSHSTIRQWVKDKKIPETSYIKIGLTYRFHLPAVQDALVNYKNREGMTDEQRAKIADDILNSIDGVLPNDAPEKVSEEKVQAAEAELESKVRGVPHLKDDPELDKELEGILDEHDELQDL